MRSGRQALAVTLAAALLLARPAPAGKHLPLPAGATVRVGKKTFQEGHVSDAELCKAYSVTAAEVRRSFARYRVVSTQEKHYLYQVAPCSIQGTIGVHGRTFTWSANPGGWLTTTFPDGAPKTLGTTDPAFLDTTP